MRLGTAGGHLSLPGNEASKEERELRDGESGPSGISKPLGPATPEADCTPGLTWLYEPMPFSSWVYVTKGSNTGQYFSLL